ncbi:MAG: PqqD family peptide modification chaperone [Thermoanaerobaculia bacterium]|nr:PqqD family peptide modification chaperone [Thermoanaerobaculia bacterium]
MPRVVYEVFDEEVVALDLESGSYYSLRASAAWIFRSAAAGASAGAIAVAFSSGGNDDGEDVPAAVGAFLDSLVSEGLLVPQPQPMTPSARLDLPGSAGAFTPPRFEKFTDMQDLLLLDPIHDVDETGWPRAAEKAGGTAT